MRLSTPFKSVMVAFLLASVSIKLATGGGVRNPNFQEIEPSLGHFLNNRGYDLGGSLRYADIDGLAAMKGDCLLFLLPVAHQGWNEATVMKQASNNQDVYFIDDGNVSKSIQPRLIPTSKYYAFKFLSYIGLKGFGYMPMLAAVTNGRCDMTSASWLGIPPVKFPPLDYFSE